MKNFKIEEIEKVYEDYGVNFDEKSNFELSGGQPKNNLYSAIPTAFEACNVDFSFNLN